MRARVRLARGLCSLSQTFSFKRLRKTSICLGGHLGAPRWTSGSSKMDIWELQDGPPRWNVNQILAQGRFSLRLHPAVLNSVEIKCPAPIFDAHSIWEVHLGGPPRLLGSQAPRCFCAPKILKCTEPMLPAQYSKTIEIRIGPGPVMQEYPKSANFMSLGGLVPEIWSKIHIFHSIHFQKLNIPPKCTTTTISSPAALRTF